MDDVTQNRPLPFRRRLDIAVQPHFARGARYCVLKDPLGLNYWKLDPTQYCVFASIDGKASLESIRIELKAAFPGWHFTLTDVQQLVMDLQKKGLLIAKRTHQSASLLIKARNEVVTKILQAVQNPLFIRFPGIDPNRFLGWLNRTIGWTVHPVCVFFCVLLMIGSWVLIYVRREEVWNQMPSFEQFFAWPNVIYLWCIVGVTKVIHELGHGLATKRIGRDCHTIGFALLVLSPTMYCDATDSWMSGNKWSRMAVAAAGMYVEVLLASAAFLLWSVTLPGALKHILLNVFFVSTVSTVIFNANPLIRFDGYYILSDWLEVPNLSEQSSDYLQRTIGWCLGLEIEDRSYSNGPTWILVTYGIAAFLYRWFLMVSIAFGIYLVFKSYGVPSIGASLAVFSIGGWMIGNGRGAYSMWKRHSKGEKVRKGRCGLSLAIVLVLLIAACCVPIPMYRSAPAYVEPSGIRHIYTNVGGRLERADVAEGEAVKAGGSVAKLVNMELDDRLSDLRVQCEATRREMQAAELADDHAAFVAKSEEALQLEAVAGAVARQLEDCEIVSPVTGRVIWPERRLGGTLEQRDSSLGGWLDVPLQQENISCFVDPGTHLCSICPSEGAYEVKILIDQSDRNDLTVGSAVRVKLDAYPRHVFSATVTAISDRQSEVVPRLMSLKSGGKASTVTDSMGQERLDSNAYLVTAAWRADPSVPLQTSMRGQARFIVSDRTVLQWLYRWGRSTFSFRI